MQSHPIPNSMRQIEFRSPGEPEQLHIVEVPIPNLKSGEVLIEVHTAGVNRPDIAQRQGLYPPPPGASPVLGLEVAGIVVQCSEEQSEWTVGDNVCALVNGGGYAEYCAVLATQCLPVPKSFSMVEAAGLPETHFTVWSNVFRRGALQPGETFLVHGGSSGIGTTAIQLAHHFGSRVIATAGSDGKCDACLELGADLAINYKTEDFVAVSRKFAPDGVDLILDMVGGDYAAHNISLLGRDGRLVQISVLGGSQATLNLAEIMMKRLTITGSTLRPQSPSEKAAIAGDLREKVWPILDTGCVHPIIYKTFDLADVSSAHELMESSEHIGKIVLTVK